MSDDDKNKGIPLTESSGRVASTDVDTCDSSEGVRIANFSMGSLSTGDESEGESDGEQSCTDDVLNG